MSYAFSESVNSYVVLPCGRTYEGPWDNIQALKKRHLKICNKCKTALANGAPVLTTESDIQTHNDDYQKEASRVFRKLAKNLASNGSSS